MDGAQQAQRPVRLFLPVLFAATLIPALLGSSATLFNDGDVSWHIATGAWILDHRAIPHADPFSFTSAGRPWVPIEWLAEVLLASAYRLAGYSGVAALVTAALIALHIAVVANALRFIRPWTAVVAIIAMDLVLIPMMFARPHVLAWALAAVWMWLLLRAREKERAPPLATAVLMVIWANLHGSFVIGLGIAAAFGLEAALQSDDRRTALRQWLIFGLACAAAVFVNANGLAGVTHPFKIGNLAMLPLIDEWKPSNPSVTPLFFVVLALTAALIAWKRPRMSPVRWALLVVLLALAFLQARHQAMLAIIAAMLLPAAFARTSPAGSEQKPVLRIAAVAALLFVAVRAAMPLQIPYNATNPWPLIARVPPALRVQPVLNSYDLGGPLILRGIRPYIDGRGDMYGDAFVLGFKRILSGDPAAFADAQRAWRFRWAILDADADKLIALLDRTPGWRRIYADRVGVIYVRD